MSNLDVIEQHFAVNFLGLLKVTDAFLPFLKRSKGAIVTFSFIPLEIYELARRATLARGIVLLLNVGVVIYLAVDLRRTR